MLFDKEKVNEFFDLVFSKKIERIDYDNVSITTKSYLQTLENRIDFLETLLDEIEDQEHKGAIHENYRLKRF